MTAIKCDLRKVSDIEAMFRQIQSTFGAVDVCINNAGLAHNAPLLSGENEEWREILEVFMSLIFKSKHFQAADLKTFCPCYHIGAGF